MNRIFRNTVFYLLIFLVIIGVVSFFSGDQTDADPITSDEFLTALEQNEVQEMTVKPEREVYLIEGQMAQAAEDETFKTHVLISEDTTDALMTASGPDGQPLQFDTEPADETGGWVTFFTSVIPFIIIFILFFFLLSQAQGGGGGKMMNFGKSKAKMVPDDKKQVRFKDVAGAEEEKQELVEVVEFLKDPRKFANIGARIPKGVLLVGPPGTGKTLLGRAVAGEAGVPFFSISGSDFVEMFVGVGASRVRDLFENAKKNAPCIIFIDEIDAVGRQRGAGLGGGHDEREQTLNQLLVEMDGFGANEGIIIIAATNRADVLDPALLRPGRFDRQITVGLPDVNGREEVLGVHVKNKPISENVDLKAVAQRTPGFSGADLENLLNEAALVAARADSDEIQMVHVEEAIDRVVAGPAKKSRVISEKEKNIVAHHEAGHTVVGVKLQNADMVHKVTIVPRGQAGGYAVMLPKEDRYFMTKPELLDKIVGLLGGRVAEEVMFDEVSTGAHNDFQRATAIARKMVTEYGMSEKLGPLQFGSNSGGQVFLGRDIQNDQNYSDAIAHEIDLEVQRLITESYDRCKQILTEHKDKLELVAEKLLELETLDAEQIRSLVDDGKLPEGHHSNENQQDAIDASGVNKDENSSTSDGNSDDMRVNIQSKPEDAETPEVETDENTSSEDTEHTDSENNDQDDDDNGRRS
ncbi:membrane protease FtsH catalytic subunit [Salsuginibacillus halophilus]|uniref:ATP-dependent zinc metalloprotease FtsH n=1 Tax=Salsuginibacillus halophilus TaxID=517424 RepID=A0A2P8H7S0_9BACI|nr:ATP-dependent zinc metalloprotease FtsH [Salsuginibacillus halophilus]PSL42273.1 membrane protease FtsH catalytic subunit [Salsuginibacillus halophilus]